MRTDGHTYRRTDMTKLIIAFRNFCERAQKKVQNISEKGPKQMLSVAHTVGSKRDSNPILTTGESQWLWFYNAVFGTVHEENDEISHKRNETSYNSKFGTTVTLHRSHLRVVRLYILPAQDQIHWQPRIKAACVDRTRMLHITYVTGWRCLRARVTVTRRQKLKHVMKRPLVITHYEFNILN